MHFMRTGVYTCVVGAAWEFMPASLPFGTALHAAVAAFYRSLKDRGVQPELASITREFEREWEKAVAGQRLTFKGEASVESQLEQGRALLGKFYEEVRPRRVEAVEYPFAVPLTDPHTGEALETTLVGIVDLIESDDEGNLIIGELKTSSKLALLIQLVRSNRFPLQTRRTQVRERYTEKGNVSRPFTGLPAVAAQEERCGKRRSALSRLSRSFLPDRKDGNAHGMTS
jgi:hypothetical protein